MNNELFAFLQIFDDDDLPDGAWQAKIEDGVEEWNKDHPTAKLDPFDTWLAYIKACENQEKNI